MVAWSGESMKSKKDDLHVSEIRASKDSERYYENDTAQLERYINMRDRRSDCHLWQVETNTASDLEVLNNRPLAETPSINGAGNLQTVNAWWNSWDERKIYNWMSLAYGGYPDDLRLWDQQERQRWSNECVWAWIPVARRNTRDTTVDWQSSLKCPPWRRRVEIPHFARQ